MSDLSLTIGATDGRASPILRCVYLVVGALVLFDAASPLREETLTVRSLSDRKWQESRRPNASAPLYLEGGSVSACGMTNSAVLLFHGGEKVQGEKVLVQSTRLITSCVRVIRDGDEMFHAKWRRPLAVAGACLLIAGGIFGWRFKRSRPWW
jgi:hypothetical protein